MREYLSSFANVKYQVVDSSGTGTCSGVKQAIDLIPDAESFKLVWSDLILPDSLELPKEYEHDKKPEHNYVVLSETFSCRWKYENGSFKEERSTEYGVACFFLFTDKKIINNVPESGELGRRMSEQKLSFETVSLAGTREFGLLEEYEKIPQAICRPLIGLLLMKMF